jgi:predicted house-cleaning noncanonical NTP pyrophosphatase (MazG superfamily)
MRSDDVFVRTGVWYCDDNGEIIPGSGKAIAVRESEKNKYGIFLRPKPMSVEEWVEFCKNGKQFSLEDILRINNREAK